MIDYDWRSTIGTLRVKHNLLDIFSRNWKSIFNCTTFGGSQKFLKITIFMFMYVTKHFSTLTLGLFAINQNLTRTTREISTIYLRIIDGDNKRVCLQLELYIYIF